MGIENAKVITGREKGKEEEKEGAGNRGWKKERVGEGKGKGGVCSFARKKRPSFDRKSQT